MSTMRDMTEEAGRERERESNVQGADGRWIKIQTREKVLAGDVNGRIIWTRMADRLGVEVEGRCRVGYQMQARIGLWGGESIAWGK